jgi:hypothetical protein
MNVGQIWHLFAAGSTPAIRKVPPIGRFLVADFLARAHLRGYAPDFKAEKQGARSYPDQVGRTVVR